MWGNQGEEEDTIGQVGHAVFLALFLSFFTVTTVEFWSQGQCQQNIKWSGRYILVLGCESPLDCGDVVPIAMPNVIWFSRRLLSVHISESNFCINTWHRQWSHEASQNLDFDPLEMAEPYIKPFPSVMGFTLEILRGVSGSRRCVLDCPRCALFVLLVPFGRSTGLDFLAGHPLPHRI